MTKEYPLFTDADGNVWTTECEPTVECDVIDPAVDAPAYRFTQKRDADGCLYLERD